MSGYQPGRRGPNVSQYIAGLNQIPQENDFTLDESYNFEDDLALFTNTEFIHNDIIDFDLDFDFTQAIPGEEEYLKQDQIQQQEEKLQQKRLQEDHSSDTNPIIQTHLHNSIHPPPSSPQPSITSITTKKQKLSTHSGKATKRAVVSASSSSSSSSSSLTVQEESPSSPTISFETSTVGAASLAPSNEEPLSISIPANDNNSTSQAGNGAMNFDGDFHFTDIGFTPQGNITNHNIPYGASTSGYDYNLPPQSPFDPKHQLNTPVSTPPNGILGVRPQGILPDAAALHEASSRAAAEEDKRRRNTAASARFRYKKKQREHALEKSSKDMTDKLEKLEDRINQLEKENNWLRELVVERTAKTSEEMAELYKTFKEEERSKESHKKGVGTLQDEK